MLGVPRSAGWRNGLQPLLSPAGEEPDRSETQTGSGPCWRRRSHLLPGRLITGTDWLYSQAGDIVALIICITWFLKWQATFYSSFMLFVRCTYRDRQALQSICVHFIHTSEHFINVYWYGPNVAVPPGTTGAVLSTVASIAIKTQQNVMVENDTWGHLSWAQGQETTEQQPGDQIGEQLMRSGGLRFVQANNSEPVNQAVMVKMFLSLFVDKWSINEP